MNGDKLVKPEDRRLLGSLEDTLVENTRIQEQNTREQRATRAALESRSQSLSQDSGGNGAFLKWSLTILAAFIIGLVGWVFATTHRHSTAIVRLQDFERETRLDRFRQSDGRTLEFRIREYVRDQMDARHSP